MIRHGISSWVLVWYCFMLQKKITFWELKNQSSITYITNLWSQTGSGHVIFNITKFYSTCKRKFRIFFVSLGKPNWYFLLFFLKDFKTYKRDHIYQNPICVQIQLIKLAGLELVISQLCAMQSIVHTNR